MKLCLLALLGAVTLCAQTLVIKESPNRNGYYTIAPAPQESAAQSSGNESAAQTPARFYRSGDLKKRISSDNAVKPNRFYRYGDPSQEYVSTNALIVSFADAKDAEAINNFAAKWNLSNPRQISVMFNTWVFDNPSSDDDLTLSSKIGQSESDIRFAKPDFIAHIEMK
ncbi:MAG: hypothetical protein LBP89_03695 [Helicobacteraceae bacterium]|jgi:hypothetical protein|nr:hypothetical protein [Helicobacteraceae bacterium]